MAGNTRPIITDVDSKPAPQYFNPTADVYEFLEGRNGASRVELYDADGEPVDIMSALSLLGKEATLSLIKAGIDALITKDGATAAKQDALKAVVDSLDAKDYSTETTLAALKAVVDTIATTAAERATEATAQAILTKMDPALPVSINGNIATRLAGNSAEVSSSQHAELAGTTATYELVEGASKLEVYLESGYIRIRTDGQPATATTGEPLGEGFGASWAVGSISIYFVEDAVLTVVSRQ